MKFESLLNQNCLQTSNITLPMSLLFLAPLSLGIVSIAESETTAQPTVPRWVWLGADTAQERETCHGARTVPSLACAHGWEALSTQLKARRCSTTYRRESWECGHLVACFFCPLFISSVRRADSRRPRAGSSLFDQMFGLGVLLPPLDTPLLRSLSNRGQELLSGHSWDCLFPEKTENDHRVLLRQHPVTSACLFRC